MAALGTVQPGTWPTPDGWNSKPEMVSTSVSDYDINIGLKYGPVQPGTWPTPDGWNSKPEMVESAPVTNYVIRMIGVINRLLWPTSGQRWPLGRVEL